MKLHKNDSSGFQMKCLYHLPLSPFCRKIRLVLAEKKLEVDLIEELVWEGRLDFLRLNPAAKVPVLIIGDLVLSDSTAIFEYLEEVYPFPALLPEGPAERAEARRLTFWFDDKFHSEVTSKLLYQRITKKLSRVGHPDSTIIKAGVKALKFHFEYLDYILERRRWLAGDKMTIADFSGAAHFSTLDYIGDIDWSCSYHIKNWYEKIKSRPAFRSLLSDYLPGFHPPEHYSDLDF